MFFKKFLMANGYLHAKNQIKMMWKRTKVINFFMET